MNKNKIFQYIMVSLLIFRFTFAEALSGSQNQNSHRNNELQSAVNSANLAPSTNNVETLLLTDSGNPGLLKRLRNLTALSFFIATGMAMIYSLDGFDWYLAIKNNVVKNTIINWPGATLDMLSGMIIWGMGDLSGQYLEAGNNIRRKQLLWLVLAGIPIGLMTHIIYNIANILPELRIGILDPFPKIAFILKDMPKIIFTLTIGLVFTYLFARIISQAKNNNMPEEKWKQFEVILFKAVLAPIKACLIFWFLPHALQVPCEQIWDFYITIFCSYLMNRNGLLILHKIPAIQKRYQKNPSSVSYAA